MVRRVTRQERTCYEILLWIGVEKEGKVKRSLYHTVCRELDKRGGGPGFFYSLHDFGKGEKLPYSYDLEKIINTFVKNGLIGDYGDELYLTSRLREVAIPPKIYPLK